MVTGHGQAIATTNAPLALQTSARVGLDRPEPHPRHLHPLRSPNERESFIWISRTHQDPATPFVSPLGSPNEREGIADPPPPSLSPPRVRGDVAASSPPPPPPLRANASWEC